MDGTVTDPAGMNSVRKGEVGVRLHRYNGAKLYKAQEFKLDFVQNG